MGIFLTSSGLGVSSYRFHFFFKKLNLIFFYSCGEKSYYSKLRQSRHGNYYKCLIIEHNILTKFKGFETSDTQELKVFTKPAVVSSSDERLQNLNDAKIVEIFAKTIQVLDNHIESICKTREFVPSMTMHEKMQQIAENTEIRKIVDSGDQRNRIDVVFMGDGYTADERDQFFEDIQRLTEDMFNGDTFRSYLPLFNIWAIHVESTESGIGYNGAKDTPFRLYRQQGQLRAIYTANAQYARQVKLFVVHSNLKQKLKTLCLDLSTNRSRRL